MPVILIGNHKGGVGKTTACTALCAELAMTGRQVLAIDLDPQANLTRRLGYKRTDLAGQPNIAAALTSRDYETFKSCLVRCKWPAEWAKNVWLAPGHVDLESVAQQGSALGAWVRLRSLLANVNPEVCVLIDTPPSMGHLVQMGLVAADHVLVITQAEHDSVMGALYLRDFIDTARTDLGLTCQLGGVIINNLRKIGVHQYRTQELRAQFEGLLWEPFIPQR